MQVLLRRNVSKLGRIGDVVEVKNGYARNYLLPHRIATAPTEANIKAIEADKQVYLAELAKQQAELKAQADLIQGKEVTITSRSNDEGHLYGSVGPAQIASALAEEGLFVDSHYIHLDEPLRQLDKYDVLVRFDEEISATIHVWVIRAHEEHDDADFSELSPGPDAPVESANEQTDNDAEDAEND